MIADSIRTELPEHKVAEVTVRLYVRERKRELGCQRERPVYPRAMRRDGKLRWTGTRPGRNWRANRRC